MICVFKASLPKSKIFYREYELNPDMTLYDLHCFLINDLGFSPDQMVMMRGLVKGKEAARYGLFDLGDGSMDAVSVSDLMSRGQTVIEYVFDMFNGRYISLSYIGETEEFPRVSYPRIVAEKGHNPEQFAKNDDNYDRIEAAVNGSSFPGGFSDDPDSDDEEPDEEEMLFDDQSEENLD